MKRAIDILDPGNLDYSPFTIMVREPGKLRGIMTAAKQASTIITADMGKPEVVPVPALMFEIDPDKPERERKFVWLPASRQLTFEGNLEYRDKYTDPKTGEPFFLYEAMKPRD